MCGILGTTNVNIDSSSLIRSIDYIQKRGPDFTGKIVLNQLIFIHTRLSIIDLNPNSNQPFEYIHGLKKVTVVFNGEIYNFQKLKHILVKIGYKFNTFSDTEVLCAAFLEYGLDAFNLFEGMWACAIYYEDSIYLARDRNGKKPLYYSITNGHLYFSSSLRSIQTLISKVSISCDALELYFALGFIPGEYSIFNEINKLIPGQILNYSLTKKSILNADFSCFTPLQVERYASISACLNQSVKNRLISDYPISTLMSGGVDSSIITSILNREKDVEAYFLDFNGKSFSEESAATKIALRNKIKMNTLKYNLRGAQDALNLYYDIFEEPFADYGALPLIDIFKSINRKYRVVMTGDGGDELFYGYPHYYKKFLLWHLPGFVKKRFYYRYQNVKLVFNRNNFESSYLSRNSIVTTFAGKYIDKMFNKTIVNSGSFLAGVIEYDRSFNTWPEKYLTKLDRTSMFFGIEIRAPFMDENLKAFTKKIKLFKLFTPRFTKLYLKLKFINVFGFLYLFSKKKGFTPPIQELRNQHFSEIEFNKVVDFLKINFPNFYLHSLNLSYKELKKNDILFDRFLFFSLWLKTQKYL